MARTMMARGIGIIFNTSAIFSKPQTAKWAFQLFCTPLKGRHSKEDQEFLKSADKLILQNDGEQFASYHWSGKGPTVLFVHGWESNSVRWKSYIDNLRKKDLNIIAIDAPAHGASASSTITVPKYAAAIDILAKIIHPDIMIGHSLGGLACSHFLDNFNCQTKKLVLLSTPSPLLDMMYRFFDILGLRKDLMNNLAQLFDNDFSTNLYQYSTASNLSNHTLNGIIVHDQLDEVTPYQESLLIAESWKNSIHIPTRGLGHSLKDDRIISAICAYISDDILPKSIIQ
ncbi:MAG: alpha/beta hydrolase [Bacteroidia bacterium]|nr:alpha/beta hydrolase [Bacteroidia bacterium]